MSAAETAYARALFGAAAARDKLVSVADDLRLLTPVIEEHRNFFFNSGLPVARQIGFLRDCLDGQADPLTVQFLALLCARRRLNLLSRIRQRFDVLCADALGEIRVRLHIPYQPTDALLATLRGALGDMGLYPPERKDFITFEVNIDQSLLGGFTAECGGKVLDASLRTRLLNLKV